MTLKPEDHALIARLMARQPNLMLRGHEGYYRHDDIIEAVQLIGKLAAAREEARPDPRPSPVGREEVARVIDPDPWGSHDRLLLQADEPGRAPETAQRWRTVGSNLVAPSLAKADAILALFSPADGWRAKEGVADAER